MQAEAFAQIAVPAFGRVAMQYRRVDCEPNTDLTVSGAGWVGERARGWVGGRAGGHRLGKQHRQTPGVPCGGCGCGQLRARLLSGTQGFWVEPLLTTR